MNVPWSHPQPMTDGSWCINTPDLYPLGKTTLWYVVNTFFPEFPWAGIKPQSPTVITGLMTRASLPTFPSGVISPLPAGTPPPHRLVTCPRILVSEHQGEPKQDPDPWAPSPGFPIWTVSNASPNPFQV